MSGYLLPTHPTGDSLGFPRGKGPLGFPPPEAGDSRETHGWEWQATTHPWLTFPTYLDQVPRAVEGWLHRESWGERKNKGGFVWGVGILLKGWFELVKKIFTYISKDFFGKKRIWVVLLQFFEHDCLNWRSTRWPSFLSSLYRFLKKGGRPWLPVLCNCRQLFHHRNINRRLTSCLIQPCCFTTMSILTYLICFLFNDYMK